MYFSQEEIDTAQINPFRKDLPGAGYYAPIVCEILEGIEWTNGSVSHKIGIEREVDDCIYWKRPAADEDICSLGLEEWISQTYPLWEIKEIGIVALAPGVNLSITIDGESSSRPIHPTSTTEPGRVRILRKEDYRRELSFKVGGSQGRGNIAVYAIVKPIGDTDDLIIPRDSNGDQCYWSYTDPDTGVTKKQFIFIPKTQEEKITYYVGNAGRNWQQMIFDQLNDDYPCGRVTEVGVIPLTGGTGTFTCGLAEDKGSDVGNIIFKMADHTVTLSTTEVVRFRFPIPRVNAIIYASRLRFQVPYKSIVYFKYIPHTLRFEYRVADSATSNSLPGLTAGFRLDSIYYKAYGNGGTARGIPSIKYNDTVLIDAQTATTEDGPWMKAALKSVDATLLNTAYTDKITITKLYTPDTVLVLMVYKKKS